MKFLKILLLLSTPLISVNYLVAQEQNSTIQEPNSTTKAPKPTTGPHDATITPGQAATRINNTTQATPAQELPFYRENEHFIFFCEPIDQPAVDKMLEEFEPFLKKISAEFNHVCTSKFTFKVYPNINKFHEAAGIPDAPNRVCTSWTENPKVALSVSPNNTGSEDTVDLIMRANLCTLVGLVIKDKYKNNITAPGWFFNSICSYKSSVYNDITEKILAQNAHQLPTFQKLNQTYGNIPEWLKIQGWQVGYSIAKFIDKKYGIDKLLALLENDNSTQLVLGVTEDELRQEWINYLVSEYGQKDSSGKALESTQSSQTTKTLESTQANQATPAQELPFYKENEHFAFYCEWVDQAIVDTISEKCEAFLKQLTTDFDHNLTQKITFKIYPNIKDLHVAISCPNAPDWVCADTNAENNTYYFVSPNNPGTVHNFDFMMTRPIFGLTSLFMHDKYKNSLPGWLHVGICCYKCCSDFYGDKGLLKYINNIPTIQQLTQVYADGDYLQFAKLMGWHVSCSLVRFIDKKYGWAKIRALLDNYSAMQSILGVTQDELRAEWANYLVSEYGQAGVGAKS